VRVKLCGVVLSSGLGLMVFLPMHGVSLTGENALMWWLMGGLVMWSLSIYLYEKLQALGRKRGTR
jgi:hypothetical protein